MGRRMLTDDPFSFCVPRLFYDFSSFFKKAIDKSERVIYNIRVVKFAIYTGH